MRSSEHNVTLWARHGAESEQRFQIQQGIATYEGCASQGHSATDIRIEHPLRDLQMPDDWTLFTPAIEHASPLLAECLIYHDATAAPGMPGITNFAGF